MRKGGLVLLAVLTLFCATAALNPNIFSGSVLLKDNMSFFLGTDQDGAISYNSNTDSIDFKRDGTKTISFDDVSATPAISFWTWLNFIAGTKKITSTGGNVDVELSDNTNTDNQAEIRIANPDTGDVDAGVDVSVEGWISANTNNGESLPSGPGLHIGANSGTGAIFEGDAENPGDMFVGGGQLTLDGNLKHVSGNIQLSNGETVGTENHPSLLTLDDASGVTAYSSLYAGADDTRQGVVSIFGGAIGGGQLWLNNGAATDTYTEGWYVKASDDFAIADSTKDRFTIDSETGNLTIDQDLQVNGGNIGISTDTDLLFVTNDLLTINGDVVVTGDLTAETVNGSVGFNGAQIDFYLPGEGEGEGEGDPDASIITQPVAGGVDMEVYETSTDTTMIRLTGGGVNMNRAILFPGAGSERYLMCNAIGSLDGSDGHGAGNGVRDIIKFEDDALATATTHLLGDLSWGDISHVQSARISSSLTDATEGSEDGQLVLKTVRGGTEDQVGATLSSVGDFTLAGDLLADGGNVGITADADLLGLTNGQLTINGTGKTTGDLLVDGGDIGITVDADLLHLASGAATINGTLDATGKITSTDLTVNDSASQPNLIVGSTSQTLQTYSGFIGVGGKAEYGGQISLYTPTPSSGVRSWAMLAGSISGAAGNIGSDLAILPLGPTGTILANVFSIDSDTFNTSLSNDLQVNGGKIGISTDADLLTMTDNKLTVSGVVESGVHVTIKEETIDSLNGLSFKGADATDHVFIDRSSNLHANVIGFSDASDNTFEYGMLTQGRVYLYGDDGSAVTSDTELVNLGENGGGLITKKKGALGSFSGSSKTTGTIVSIPSGAIILAVLGNLEKAITAGGTSVTISLGTSGDPDKYGTVSPDALTKNSKINKMVAWEVLSSQEDIIASACVSGGASLGDTNPSALADCVRAMVIYQVLDPLPNAE